MPSLKKYLFLTLVLILLTAGGLFIWRYESKPVFPPTWQVLDQIEAKFGKETRQIFIVVVGPDPTKEVRVVFDKNGRYEDFPWPVTLSNVMEGNSPFEVSAMAMPPTYPPSVLVSSNTGMEGISDENHILFSLVDGKIRQTFSYQQSFDINSATNGCSFITGSATGDVMYTEEAMEPKSTKGEDYHVWIRHSNFQWVPERKYFQTVDPIEIPVEITATEDTPMRVVPKTKVKPTLVFKKGERAGLRAIRLRSMFEKGYQSEGPHWYEVRLLNGKSGGWIDGMESFRTNLSCALLELL